MEQHNKTLNTPLFTTWLGIFLVAAGGLIVAAKLSLGIPEWLVSWPIAVIAIGLLIGIQWKFRAGFWLIPLFWGTYLLIEELVPSLDLANYASPVSLILAGIAIILIRRRRRLVKFEAQFEKAAFINVTGFGGVTKRDIISNNFKGADVTSVMGSTIIDLRNADIQGKALVDVTVFLGSAKIYIPKTWAVDNDVTTVFGEVKYHPVYNGSLIREDKTIRLDGTALFGKIEVIAC
jgi:predicted membrane protein